MAQSRFQARIREEFQASKSLVMESQDTLSLRDIRRLLADRLGEPQKAVDNEKRLVANLVDEAIQEHSGASVQVISSDCVKLSSPSTHCMMLMTGVLFSRSLITLISQAAICAYPQRYGA